MFTFETQLCAVPGSCCGIDQIRFLAGWYKRPLNQVLVLVVIVFTRATLC